VLEHWQVAVYVTGAAVAIVGALGMWFARMVAAQDRRQEKLWSTQLEGRIHEHEADCEARGLAHADPDDSGAAPVAVTHREPSRRFRR